MNGGLEGLESRVTMLEQRLDRLFSFHEAYRATATVISCGVSFSFDKSEPFRHPTYAALKDSIPITAEKRVGVQ